MLTLKKQADGYFYKFNERAILRTDSKQRWRILQKLMNNGIYTLNEAREYEDKPAKPGGDILMVNGNYIPAIQVGQQYKGGAGDGSELM